MAAIQPSAVQYRTLFVAAVFAVTSVAACASILGVDSIALVDSVGDAGHAGDAERADVCTSPSDCPPPEPAPEDEDATLPDAPPEVLPDGEAPPELDATIPETGPDAANPCQGKADGFAPNPGTPLVRCCGGSLVALNTTSNCGACGIACAPGRACEQVRVGKYSCHCFGNAECTNVGTGVGSTCYPALDGWCNCQCPNDQTSCTNVCRGGATCYDITGQNYCSYP